MRAVIAVVVLAAGASRRLGRPKQTVVIEGEMLVERAARVALEAALGPVLVVVPPENDFAEKVAALGCRVVVNPAAAKGMAASIRCGVAAAAGAAGVVVMACDQPAVRAGHLRALCAQPERMTGSGYAGRVGVPAYFPAAAFAALLRLEGDAGARELLQGAAAVQDEALALDIDTAMDLQRHPPPPFWGK